nr:integrase arm-type DNA-binding domain-containing protein [uncultured Cohaesibacter sp.]
MPKTGPHPDKALTAIGVNRQSKPGWYADGNGLYLVVDKSGAKRWMLRLMVQGRRRDMGLGGISLVSLAEARELALKYRKIARQGGDPIEERRKERLTAPIFSEAAQTVFEENKSTWKNPKHAQQWFNTLQTYAFPHIGSRQVDQIQTSDILKVLSPIWLEKAETARRVRQRMSTVFDWAKTAGFRSGDNPVDGVEKGLPKQNSKDKHHAAMPYQEVPAFVARIRTEQKKGLVARLALEFLILTATRTSEVLKSEWVEVDLDQRLWIIPAERMKAKREHRVPLCDRSIEILKLAEGFRSSGDLIFPGQKIDRPMSNMVFLTMLKRMDVPFTAHGFRSSFRDWAAETTAYPREIAEMALAHTIQNKVEAAYRRSDLLERRRTMMDDWSAYISI